MVFLNFYIFESCFPFLLNCIWTVNKVEHGFHVTFSHHCMMLNQRKLFLWIKSTQKQLLGYFFYFFVLGVNLLLFLVFFFFWGGGNVNMSENIGRLKLAKFIITLKNIAFQSSFWSLSHYYKTVLWIECWIFISNSLAKTFQILWFKKKTFEKAIIVISWK